MTHFVKEPLGLKRQRFSAENLGPERPAPEPAFMSHVGRLPGHLVKWCTQVGVSIVSEKPSPSWKQDPPECRARGGRGAGEVLAWTEGRWHAD